jgi:hypothetical protein
MQAPATPPAATPTKGDGLSLSRIKTGVVKTWDKAVGAMPWVHESRNAAQVDPTVKKGVESPFTKDARAVFTKVDTNKDGYLTTRELNKAMDAPQIKKGEAAAVGAMQESVDDIEDLSNDERFLETKGITRKDLDQFDRLKSDSHIHSTASGTYATATWRIDAANRELYPKGANSVRGDAIDQGNLGDCYFLASVAGQANRDPDSIRKMIKDNGNGTYTVTFANRKPITINAPTDAEIGRYSTGTDDGMWVRILEKAYVHARDRSRLIKAADPYKAVEGGFLFQGQGAMTGSVPGYRLTKVLSDKQVVDFVRKGTENNRLMTASTGPKLGGKDETRDGLAKSHVYTVVGYNETKGTIRIRNPWGSGGDDGKGGRELTPKQVRDNFLIIAKQR